ncbi:DUF6471 domain-containing protein [Rhodopseudomonas palustris]|uniref:DUF6471 domain-containing protein n=1 Tax=Rhodopseudomonas palustris TaxID=1076 RepID=UPI0039F52DFC
MRHSVAYRALAERLTAIGIPETERNIAIKISRGGFTAAFLIHVLQQSVAHHCDWRMSSPLAGTPLNTPTG